MDLVVIGMLPGGWTPTEVILMVLLAAASWRLWQSNTRNRLREAKEKCPTPTALTVIESQKPHMPSTEPTLAATILAHEQALRSSTSGTRRQRVAGRWQALVAGLAYKKRREVRANAVRFAKKMPQKLDTTRPTGSTDRGGRWSFREVRSFW